MELMGDGFSHAGGLARLGGDSEEEDRGGRETVGTQLKAWPVLAWRDVVDTTRATMARTS